eukprot:TRINITY_DN1541_c1_g1_i1.p1 TRINITY_DN1541_c1_g1~~TRINITY_DN1541_c1_g1_i1.p1  ORF type:complete len:463 (+),score=46.15 TRINITY_DN1541_c1_g1_i1:3-1391(+)
MYLYFLQTPPFLFFVLHSYMLCADVHGSDLVCSSTTTRCFDVAMTTHTGLTGSGDVPRGKDRARRSKVETKPSWYELTFEDSDDESTPGMMSSVSTSRETGSLSGKTASVNSDGSPVSNTGQQIQLVSLSVAPPADDIDDHATHEDSSGSSISGTTELMNVGSALHREGTCIPCKFSLTKRGCNIGLGCNFCHYPHEGVTRNTLRKRLRFMKRQLHGKAQNATHAEVAFSRSDGQCSDLACESTTPRRFVAMTMQRDLAAVKTGTVRGDVSLCTLGASAKAKPDWYELTFEDSTDVSMSGILSFVSTPRETDSFSGKTASMNSDGSPVSNTGQQIQLVSLSVAPPADDIYDHTTHEDSSGSSISGTTELMNVGSALHREGTCVPCKFSFSKRGCNIGLGCNFCHYPHEGVTRNNLSKRLHFLKREQRKTQNATHAQVDVEPRSANCGRCSASVSMRNPFLQD